MLSRALQTTRGRLVLLLGAVAVVLLGSAAIAQLFNEYDDFGAALWGATVHLLDPSSLQDDEGGAARAIGLFQVVTGLVLLVGLLFTFVSETVGRSLERLGQSELPVRARDHLLIVAGAELAAAEAAAVVLMMPSREGPVAAETADVETTQAGVALGEYLERRGATPRVCLLFRRGRNVDAARELLPDAWDVVVTDRTVTALLRLGITHPETLAGLPEIGDLAPFSTGYPELVRAAWRAAEGERRPLRLAIVGCNFDAPALMEDLAAAAVAVAATGE